MARQRPHMKAPGGRGLTRPNPPEAETRHIEDGLWRRFRDGHRVGDVILLPESEECVLAGDESARRYPSLDAAIAELDWQYDKGKGGPAMSEIAGWLFDIGLVSAAAGLLYVVAAGKWLGGR